MRKTPETQKLHNLPRRGELAKSPAQPAEEKSAGINMACADFADHWKWRTSCCASRSRPSGDPIKSTKQIAQTGIR
jgi:hypothetical protein